MREVWDAYDAEGNKLGFDLYRDEADKIPDGIYHLVVEIITVTRQKQVLITQRDPRKPFGLKWEFTGGSALKGETAEMGAVRELKEETGILQKKENFTLLQQIYKGNCLYVLFAHTIEDDTIPIVMQEGETIDYRFIPAEALKETVNSEEFPQPIKDRFPIYEDELLSYIKSIK